MQTYLVRYMSFLLTFWTVSVALTSSLLAQQASLQGLGDLPGGGFASYAYGISADGKVVVGHSESAHGEEAFLWTKEKGMRPLGKIQGGALAMHANAVSADGSVIVGWANGKRGEIGLGDEEAFRWTAKDGAQMLGDLGGEFGPFRSHAFGVSADGSIVVGTASVSRVGEDGQNYSRMEAFRWTSRTGMVRRGSVFEFDSWSEIMGISGDGSLSVGDCMPPDESASVGTIWIGEARPLRLPPMHEVPIGVFSRGQCNAVSLDGTAIVGENCGDAFLMVLSRKLLPGKNGEDSQTKLATEGGKPWKNAPQTGLHKIGRLPHGQPAAASAVSANGSVVVGWSGAKQGSEETIIWDETNGLRTLDSVLTQAGVELKGWRLLGARGISADGTVVVGEGKNPEGNSEAWIVRLPVTR